jgi:hypothetical protein
MLRRVSAWPGAFFEPFTGPLSHPEAGARWRAQPTPPTKVLRRFLATSLSMCSGARRGRLWQLGEGGEAVAEGVLADVAAVPSSPNPPGAGYPPHRGDRDRPKASDAGCLAVLTAILQRPAMRPELGMNS